ncbi:MAG: 16S rRNA processing protein RimM [Proteobacteria bacterium]|nr:16S rRNA processing protein RimM [Pseudomonadota bacterium]
MAEGGVMGGGNFIRCGRIGRAVGLKGECAVHWMSGASPVGAGGRIILEDSKGKGRIGYTVAALRKHGRSNFVRLEGVSDRAAAELLTNSAVFISKETLVELPAGQYYCHEIEGMEVVTEDGTPLGRVARIFAAGGSDVYEVVSEGGEELLVPAIDSVVLSIDVEKKRIVIRPLDGMLDDNK